MSSQSRVSRAHTARALLGQPRPVSEEGLWQRSKREGREIREGFLEGRCREGQESTERIKESRLSGQHV